MQLGLRVCRQRSRPPAKLTGHRLGGFAHTHKTPGPAATLGAQPVNLPG